MTSENGWIRGVANDLKGENYILVESFSMNAGSGEKEYLIEV
jgi:hypothetical protein